VRSIVVTCPSISGGQSRYLAVGGAQIAVALLLRHRLAADRRALRDAPVQVVEQEPSAGTEFLDAGHTWDVTGFAFFLVDRLDLEPNVNDLLERTGLTDRVTPIFAETSFTWELKRMLESADPPQFDFVGRNTGTSARMSSLGKETTAYEAAPSVPLAPSQRRHPSAPAPRAAGAQRRRMQPRPA
jgi:hypothetical protein